MNYNFYIVAIGASAGGLQSIKDFFSKKINRSLAYIVALHTLRTAKSELRAIISRVTEMPVVDILNNHSIEPGKIYIHPPSMKVNVSNGKFFLEVRPKEERINRTIDHLFVSLAEDAKEKVIGIIMSGTGSDGTEGFHVIEENGGRTIVQDPSTAQFDGMPLSSIRYDHPSYILPPGEMPVAIGKIVSG